MEAGFGINLLDFIFLNPCYGFPLLSLPLFHGSTKHSFVYFLNQKNRWLGGVMMSSILTACLSNT